MKKISVLGNATFIALIVSPLLCVAQEEEFGLGFGGEEFISIASGYEQRTIDVPAVTTVITEADIKAMHAKSVGEVLETVPGLHVSVDSGGYQQLLLMRGIHSNYNPHMLMLLNGTPLTNIFTGNRGQIADDLQIHNIQRIEIIRGPGSALYGADAYAGVINIITDAPDGKKQTIVGAGAGSFNTQSMWLTSKNQWGRLRYSSSIQYEQSDGCDCIVDSDFQTILDGLTGTSASQAPGPINASYKRLDVHADLSQGGWRLQGFYFARRDIGNGAGAAGSLDPGGSGQGDRLLIKLQYKADIVRQLKVKWDASFFDISNLSNLYLFPKGSTGPVPIHGDIFSEGLIGNPDVYERHYRSNLSMIYSGIKDHIFNIGGGAHYGDMYRIEESKNFNSDFSAIGALINVTDTALVFNEEHRRGILFAYVQDEWKLARDLRLTGGVRGDYYSDFGFTLNPRVAAVWNGEYFWTSKLLYGRAFRPPSFAEKYNRNNPVALGNTELEPETIDTLEWVNLFRPVSNWTLGTNIYSYRMDNIIAFEQPSYVAQNSEFRRGIGAELEINWWTHTKTVSVTSNIALMRAYDANSKKAIGYAPQQQAYMRLNWRIMNDWTSYLQFHRVADRARSVGDDRGPVRNYYQVDLGGSALLLKHVELSLSLKNILNEIRREPSASPGLIANDLPMPGFHAYANLQLVF